MDQKNLANDIWQVAELLRGDFKQSEYGLVILPFTVLRRLECVLEPTRDAVVERAEQIRGKGYDPFPLLTRASGVDFYNTSSYSLGSLGLGDTRSNLLDYLDRFSPNVHAIFEQFEFTNKIDRLEEDKLLFKVSSCFAGIDLHPERVSNHEMGLAFEHLIRRFAESANDTAGEYFTPRDVVRLATCVDRSIEGGRAGRGGGNRGVRDSVQPAFLRVQATAGAGGDRCGSGAGESGDCCVVGGGGGLNTSASHACGSAHGSSKDAGLMRIKHLARINPSKSECNGFEGDRLVSFIPMESVGTRGHIDATRTKAFEEVRDGYAYVAEGDVLLAKITPCFENGKCAVAVGLTGGIGFATTEVIPLRTTLDSDARFLYYLLTSEPFRSKAIAEMYGAGGQKRVPERFVWEYQAELPHADQRRAIVALLDGETARIDTLIAKQKQLIELLKEKRQALISQAVTKGLDPDVPMKDSGVEWLGEVPAHWEVVPMKMLASVQTGIAKGKTIELEHQTTVPYLRVANVQDGFVSIEDVRMLPMARGDVKRYLLRKGDVLMNEGGDFDKLGRGAVWNGSIDPCVHQNHVFAVRPRRVEPPWLAMVTSSRYIKFYFMALSKQSTNLASISSTNLMMAPIVVPPSDERHAILEFFASDSARVLVLIAKAEEAVQLLEERRTALISAAVTGQIDVTTHAPSGTTAECPA